VSVRLAKAGAPSALTVEVCLGLELAAAITPAAVTLLMQFVALTPSTPTINAMWTVVSGSAGFVLPDLWIKDRTKRR
jgi:hypothetical protein